MTNGVVFTYRGSWAAEGFNTSWECNWRAVGSKGTILWDGQTDPKAQQPSNATGFKRELTDVAIPSQPMERQGHEGILDTFVSALQTGTVPQTECHDNIKSFAMCMAAVESAKKRKRVNVKL
jgi:predicted dehydrogenase